MPNPSARDRFFSALRSAVAAGTLVKLTLGKPVAAAADPTLRNVFVRPVRLKAGPQLAFVFRHATRDVTRNFPPDAALLEIESLLGTAFLDGHLFTPTQQLQFESQADGFARLRATALAPVSSLPPAQSHDRAKSHPVPADAPWLRALGVTNERGRPREGMADKFRQIQKFAELVTHLVAEAFPTPADGSEPGPLRIVDAGSGKGYLTFAVAHVLGSRARVEGRELRPELVELCNRVAREHGFGAVLSFAAGAILDTWPAAPAGGAETALDALIALHACDTATDDALALGVAAGARLLLVSPCCQKELRAQLTPPPILADALRHGIFEERQAEFVTDALRAQLLECAGYRTRVFEFVSTEHTARNLMIAAIKRPPGTPTDVHLPDRVRAFASFYGIRQQRLATRLNFPLTASV